MDLQPKTFAHIYLMKRKSFLIGDGGKWGKSLFKIVASITSSSMQVRIKSQKEISKFSFEPKANYIFFCISALAAEINRLKE
jgi:hypothetical protein